MVDNILKDTEEAYRHHKPTFEFDLFNGELCYVAKVVVESKIPPPGDVEISLSITPSGPWRSVFKDKSRNDEKNEFVLPGEQYAKYLQIKFLNNKYGGNFVGIRYLYIKGLKKTQIMA